MTTYNTGNPIGSTDSRDRLDNSENFDVAMNTLKPTWADRFGRTRDSFEGALSKLSFYRAGTFSAGYTLTNMRQTLEYNGHEYSWAGTFPKVVAAGATPATSGGIGVGAWVDRTDVTLRGDINIIVKRFASVADMVANVSLTVGSVVETISYHTGLGVGGNKYLVVAAGTGIADGGSYINLSNGLQVKAFSSSVVTPLEFGAYGDGISDDTTAVINAVKSNVTTLPSGYSFYVKNLTNGMKGFTGNGTLICDMLDKSYTVSDGFLMSGITLKYRQIRNFAISGSRIKVDRVTFLWDGADTTLSRYNPIEFNTCTDLTVTNISCFHGGIRFFYCSRFRLSNFYIDVDHAGEGADGSTNGTDGVKIGADSSGNISNGIILNSSRDGIDMYTSGNEINISDVYIENFYFDGVEIKSDSTANATDTPYDINITNLTVKNGGKGVGAPQAGIFINDNGLGASIPQRINISNYTANNLGVPSAASGNYSGIYINGSREVNITNSDIQRINHAQSVSSNYAIRIAGSTHINIINSILHATQRALYINGGEQIRVDNCFIGYCKSTLEFSAYGLMLSGTNKNINISNSYITGSTRSLQGEASTMLYSQITNCQLLGESYLPDFTELTVAGNNFDANGNTSDAIKMSSSAKDTLVFCNNVVKHSGRHGLYVGNISKAILTGNTFKNIPGYPFLDDTLSVKVMCANNIAGADVTNNFATFVGTGSVTVNNINH